MNNVNLYSAIFSLVVIALYTFNVWRALFILTGLLYGMLITIDYYEGKDG